MPVVQASKRWKGARPSKKPADRKPPVLGHAGAVTVDRFELLGSSRVSELGFLVVATQARRGSRVLESIGFVGVAVDALGVSPLDMNGVAAARPVLRPRRGNHRGGNPRWTLPPQDGNEARGRSPEDGEDCDRRPKPDACRAGQLPAPWQRRHGRSRNLSLVLVKPRGCGSPPGPPTRWQPTQSCSPAPPWHPAQEAGSMRAWTPCSPPPRAVSIHPGGCGLRAPDPGATPRAAWQS